MKDTFRKRNSTSSFVLLFVFFLIAIMFMLSFLHVLSNTQKKNDVVNNTTNTTTTETTTEEVPVNFSASLARIISDSEFEGKYNVEVDYNNVKFTFKCATYDEENDVCESGSALMLLNNLTYNLYTFGSSNYDYSIRPNDYYIIVQDDYVILSMNKAGIEPGVVKVFDRNGKSVKVIKNFISGYLNNDKIVNMLYPSFSNGELTMYYCSNNVASQRIIDFNNDFSFIYDEIIPEVTCY